MRKNGDAARQTAGQTQGQISGNATAVCTRGKHAASCALLARSTGRESDGFWQRGLPHRERCGAAPDRKRDRGVSSADGHTGQTNLLAARKACDHPAVHRLSCSPEADGHPASGLPDGLRHAAAGCGTVSTVGRALPWGGTFLLAAGDRPAASAGAQSAVHRLSRRG